MVFICDNSSFLFSLREDNFEVIGQFTGIDGRMVSLCWYFLAIGFHDYPGGYLDCFV